MNWPAPERRTALALVAPTTYAWGWCASCPCQMDWSTYRSFDAARDAAHTFACRCSLSERRRAQYRRAQRTAN